MNAALSVLVSAVTVLAGGAAAFAGDVFEPKTLSTSDCFLDGAVCVGEDGNETADGNATADDNQTADPEPEPEPAEENVTHYHHHHYDNATGDGNVTSDGNATADGDGPEDVHFCTTGLVLLGDSYSFSWEVQDGYEVFELDWHFSSYGLGLLSEPDVHIELVDGAGNLVLVADGDDARSFHFDTEELRGYASGEWTFVFIANDLVADQGLVGSVEY